MCKHIISILGLAGKNSTKSTYSKDLDLDLALKSGDFYNSTHCLLDSFYKSATYTFIGTKESIAFHKKLFENLPHCGEIFDKYTPIEIASDGIEDIFHHILESITNTQSQNIILDITHGFRHQPIIASSASTLAQINTNKSITIIFAKEIEPRTKYQYISLDKYLQINLIAISLQTFAKTLTVPQISKQESNPLIKALKDFSTSLHANDFNDIFKNLDKTIAELQKTKDSEDFNGLEKILAEVENILTTFTDIKCAQKDYDKHCKLATFMQQKGFYLIATTYIYEAIGLYIVDDFIANNFINETISSEYDLTNAVRYFVLSDEKPRDTKNGNVIKDFERLKSYKANNKTRFDSWKSLIGQIRRIRNDLAHIAKDIKYNTKNIGDELKRALQDLEKILSQNPSKNLQMSPLASKNKDGALQIQLQQLKNR